MTTSYFGFCNAISISYNFGRFACTSIFLLLLSSRRAISGVGVSTVSIIRSDVPTGTSILAPWSTLSIDEDVQRNCAGDVASSTSRTLDIPILHVVLFSLIGLSTVFEKQSFPRMLGNVKNLFISIMAG